ncbi:MAG: hypothetical protein ACR2Q4_11820, partial [Geminicoccaceae bacterium]
MFNPIDEHSSSPSQTESRRSLYHAAGIGKAPEIDRLTRQFYNQSKPAAPGLPPVVVIQLFSCSIDVAGGAKQRQGTAQIQHGGGKVMVDRTMSKSGVLRARLASATVGTAVGTVLSAVLMMSPVSGIAGELSKLIT